MRCFLRWGRPAREIRRWRALRHGAAARQQGQIRVTSPRSIAAASPSGQPAAAAAIATDVPGARSARWRCRRRPGGRLSTSKVSPPSSRSMRSVRATPAGWPARYAGWGTSRRSIAPMDARRSAARRAVRGHAGQCGEVETSSRRERCSPGRQPTRDEPRPAVPSSRAGGCVPKSPKTRAIAVDIAAGRGVAANEIVGCGVEERRADQALCYRVGGGGALCGNCPGHSRGKCRSALRA